MRKTISRNFFMQYSLIAFFIPAIILMHFCPGALPAARGQEISAKVTATLEKLPQNKRDELYDFAQKLEQYINSFELTNGDYPYSLACQVGVFFEEVRTTYEDRYSGRFYINTEIGAQYVDKYWDFAYNKGDQFIHAQPDFSPLLGLVDFYIYMILGEELDRLGDMQGTPYFEKCLDLANQGKFCRLPRWWDERYKETQFVLSEAHLQFREMTAVFENILFHMEEGNDVEAKDRSKNLLSLMQVNAANNREQQFMERFFNQNYKELLAVARFQDDPLYLAELMKLDPRHEDFYKSN